MCTKIFPAFRDSLERRNWGREVSIKWSCQVLVIFICSDWKRILGRGNIKTYFRIQIEFDKWQFFIEISLEKYIFASYITRDKVPTEGEIREYLQGQTEEGLYVHRQRGQKNQEQQYFSKWCLDKNALKNHSWKLWISPDFQKKVKMKKKTGIIFQGIYHVDIGLN